MNPWLRLLLRVSLVWLASSETCNAFKSAPLFVRKVTSLVDACHPSIQVSNHQGPTIRRTSSKLLLHPTVGASMALAGSSLIGMQLSKWMPSSGILGTLVSGAIAGNMLSQWIPSSHVLYDLCFTLFLPGSLTLLLLAYQPPSLTWKDELGTSSSGSNVDGPKAENSIRACILRVAAPFVIASFASLLGCWLSYRCAGIYQWFGGDLERSRTAAACLSASYVGGSVNCMATARLIGIQSDLLGSLVTADLFTMAVYFSFLSSSLDWSWLRSVFRPSAVGLDGLEDRDSTVVGSAEIETPDNQSHDSLRSKLLCSIPLLFATFGIVQLANRMEDLVGKVVPGTACAVISVVAPLINTRVNQKQWWIPFSAVSTVWSDFFFLTFFASIGVAANLSSALSMGPSCLLFSALALTIHVLGTTFGCLLWKRFLRPKSTMELEDVWIASNAAIGGPATAAAFCGQMKRDPGKLKGRTISATVWGVVGYAIGTTLGVGMYRLVGGGVV